MRLPVVPLKRYEHYFTAGGPVGRLPYVKDTARLAFRSEGVGYSGGLVDSDARRGYDFAVDHDYFERVVWPALAHRFPGFEAARCHRTWSGLYEQCELDGNPVIGRWTRGLANVCTVAGFSGHGMMHAPAAGRAIAELIVHGEYRSIDLTRLGYERVVWPALAHRFPPLEAARCHRTWAGLYEQCELDGNPIIGRWTSRLGNLYTVAGFSGHGMMHAPAAGRAIAELITHGRFETIDLSRLGYERVEANAPYTEVGIL